MDRNRFTGHATGDVVQIPHPAQPSKTDWAFIPNRLPPSWEFLNSLWPLVVEANGALGTLNGIGQTIPNPELLLRPLQAREAIASSRIEGTFVTPQQLMLFGLDQKERTGGGRSGDNLEVFNYSAALRIGHNLLQSLPFCHRVIRDMHKALMSGTHGQDARPGEYRKVQVQLGHTGRFIPPPPSHVDALMNDFETFINEKNDGPYHPLIRAFIAHYQFEAIHPFEDGNGRIGRALLAIMISEWLNHSMPWLYLSAFFEKYKDEYIDKLFKVSSNGEWASWVEFCLRGTIAQAEDSIRRCHGFNRLKRDFHASVDATARTHDIIEDLFTTPVLSISSVRRAHNVCYETAKSDIARLVKAGIVSEMDGVYPKSFMCQKLMEIAFSDHYTDEEEDG